MLNSIEQLRLDVKNLCDYHVHLIPEEEAEAYSLSAQSPARVTKKKEVWQIYILESLSIEEYLEAEAHELAHLLVYYRSPGLITMDFVEMFDENLQGLIGRIHNAIPHKLLIDELENKYNIGNGLHIHLMESSLEDITAKMRNLEAEINYKMLHAMGVYLFDIERTNPNASARVNQMIQLNATVKQAFEAAQLHLSQIKLGQSQALQRQYINKFMKDIGYLEEQDYFFFMNE